jgi:predicted  nucleic acid-binding Zn-ribbon protein
MGYKAIMSADPRLEDHVVGLELQIVELVEQRERATVQHDDAEAARIQREIDALQGEMAAAAEQLATD